MNSDTHWWGATTRRSICLKQDLYTIYICREKWSSSRLRLDGPPRIGRVWPEIWFGGSWDDLGWWRVVLLDNGCCASVWGHAQRGFLFWVGKSRGTDCGVERGAWEAHWNWDGRGIYVPRWRLITGKERYVVYYVWLLVYDEFTSVRTASIWRDISW